MSHRSELTTTPQLDPRHCRPYTLAPCTSPVPKRGSLSPNFLSPHSSPAGSTRSLPQSPIFNQQKHSSSLEGLLSHSPPVLVNHYLCPYGGLLMPRDPTQPARGDLSPTAHSHGGEPGEADDSESRDTYSLSLSPRPRHRARTCPEAAELRAKARRVKLRTTHRPPSPPAFDVDVSLLARQMATLVVKEKLHIPERGTLEGVVEGPGEEEGIARWT